MGVDVGILPVSAFVAIFAVALIIIGVVYARRRGHLQSRGALVGVAVLIALLIVFGMGLGLIPAR